MTETNNTLTSHVDQGFVKDLLSTPAGDWLAIFVAVVGIVAAVVVGYIFSAERIRTIEKRRQEAAYRKLEATNAEDTMPFGSRDIESYVEAVGLTITALKKIPDQRKLGVAAKLQKLILQLRVTHSTLVENMEFLVAKSIGGNFEDELLKAQGRLRPLLASGDALSEARTHCHDVRDAAWEFIQALEEEDKVNPSLPPIPVEVQKALTRLSYAMERADEDMILPGMQLLLTSAWQNLDDIGKLLDAGEGAAARMLRLLSGRRLMQLNRRLSEALSQMDDMASFLDRARNTAGGSGLGVGQVESTAGR